MSMIFVIVPIFMIVPMLMIVPMFIFGKRRYWEQQSRRYGANEREFANH